MTHAFLSTLRPQPRELSSSTQEWFAPFARQSLRFRVVSMALVAFGAATVMGAGFWDAQTMLGFSLIASGFAVISLASCASELGVAIGVALWGTLSVVIGGIFLKQPQLGAEAFSVTLALLMTVQAMSQIGLAVELRHRPGSFWFALSALPSILSGLLIALLFEPFLPSLIGALVGLSLVATGAGAAMFQKRYTFAAASGE